MKKAATYRNWQIWKLSLQTPKGLPIYVAIKDSQNAIESVDLQDLFADIDEAEFPKNQQVKFTEATSSK